MSSERVDYPYIRAWGYSIGSSQRHVDAEVALARRDKAPQNATFKRERWETTDDLGDNPSGRAMRARLEEIIEARGWTRAKIHGSLNDAHDRHREMKASLREAKRTLKRNR
jgi:hypothetical protein